MHRSPARKSLILAALAAPAFAAGVPDDPAKAAPLAIGARIPTVTIRNPDGTEHALGPQSLAKPTVLIFYRGGWHGVIRFVHANADYKGRLGPDTLLAEARQSLRGPGR
jgi:hypothetical protein